MVGGVGAGGGGAFKLLLAGTKSRSRLVMSTKKVPNWFTTRWLARAVNGARILYDMRWIGSAGAGGSSSFLSAGAHMRSGRATGTKAEPNSSLRLTFGMV